MFDYRSMFDLSDKTALVVWAGSGIGEACSHGLAAFGAEVVCAGRAGEHAQHKRAQAAVGDHGPGVRWGVELNLKGTFRLVRDFGRGMAKRGAGSSIAFSSIRAQTVEPGQGVYAATKSGTVQMLRALAAELGPRGVRVNTVAPGIVETPLPAQIKDSPDWYDSYAAKSILGRWAQPHEMVGAVVYLASEASSYVTGSCMLVDGGWTAADGRFTPPL